MADSKNFGPCVARYLGVLAMIALPLYTGVTFGGRRLRKSAFEVADSPLASMNLEFTGRIWYWKGPAPWHFMTVPDEECLDLAEASTRVSYGWGMIPATAQIGEPGGERRSSPRPDGTSYR